MAEELIKKSKDKFYRGKNIEELKSVDTREFSKLLKSRARRKILRNYDVIEAFVLLKPLCQNAKGTLLKINQ